MQPINDNDFLLRQVQWQSFGTYPVKNASFEPKTSNQCVFLIISISRTCNLFFFFFFFFFFEFDTAGEAEMNS